MFPDRNHLINPNAYGTVLDIGAGWWYFFLLLPTFIEGEEISWLGHGGSIQYLDRARVSRYIALEPNLLMHKSIREKADGAGFHESDGTLIILSCGAEDTQSILFSLSQDSVTVDTMISVLTLCTIPNPQRTISKLVRDILVPGGQMLYYEHVLSSRPDIAWWQRFWAPIWACVFDGCRMDRPSDIWIRDLKIGGGDEGNDVWKEWKVWGRPEENEESLFGHSVGKFVKV
jgi:hypothetical protein